MPEWLRDLRFAARKLYLDPGTSAVAVLTLALGIGASTALMSVVRTVLWEPLPYPEPERLAFVWESFPPGGYEQLTVSGADFLDFDTGVDAFESLAAFAFTGHTVTGMAVPLDLEGLAVTSSFFPLLGLEPATGRVFGTADDTSSEAVVILGYRLWQESFGGAPGVVGRVLTLSGEPYEIVGVMPAGFRGPPPFTLGGQTYSPDGATQLLVPLRRSDLATDRQRRNYFVVGRLAPGVSPETASEELAVVAEHLSATYPDLNPPGLSAYATGVEAQAAARSRPTLLVFIGAAALMLIIACANVASLLLARTMARGREMAVRASLGASRGRLVRQLLLESLLLAFMAGIVGTLLAALGLRLLPALALDWIPRLDEVRLDLPIFAFTFFLATVVGATFGLAPALQGSRAGLTEGLQEGGRGGATGRSRLRLQGAFVVLQLALALTLLAGAGLVGKSLWRLQQIDPGFDPVGQVTIEASLPAFRYDDAASLRTSTREILERLRALPEVESAGAANSLPLAGLLDGARYSVSGHEQPEGEELEVATLLQITPGFIEAMGIDLLHGRAFDEADRDGRQPVALVNERLARRLGVDPSALLGQRVRLGPRDSDRFVTVAGVVRDVRLTSLENQAEPTLYVPFDQLPGRRLAMVVRSPRPSTALMPRLRDTIREVDPDLVLAMAPLEQTLRLAVSEPRVNSLFLAAVATVALFLGAIGIAGLVSYGVTRRRHELAIRLALGARRRQVMAQLLGGGLRLALAGIAAGLVGAWAFGRFVAHLLYGVGIHDLSILAAVSLLLLVVTTLAIYVPARRALRRDPSATLWSDR